MYYQGSPILQVTPTADKLNNGCIKLLHWNIQGLCNKTSYDYIQNLLLEHDIIMLSETWVDPDSDHTFKNYTCINLRRKFKNKNALRYSGGILIMNKNSIYRKGAECVFKQCDHLCIVKLKKDFYSMSYDIFIICLFQGK